MNPSKFISFAYNLSNILTAIGANEILIKELVEYSHDIPAHLKNIE